MPMLISALRLSRKSLLLPLAIRSMSGGVSYAAAVSTPNGTLRQPQIEARKLSDSDLRSSFDDQSSRKTQWSQRPGAGIRSKTSLRGWASKKNESRERGAVQEVQHSSVPRTEYKPNTGGAEDHVYVLTFKLEDSLSQPMNEMRKQYFPRRLNKTPAHLTLFHALPHSQMEALEQGLSGIASRTSPFQVTTGGPFRMRLGVGVNVDTGYQQMRDVHSQLRAQWMPFLSKQDQGGYRPHWTVMNKVDEEKEVEHALSAVRNELSHSTKEGQATGLELWKYERGDWIWASEYIFGDEMKAPSRAQTAEPTSIGRESVANQNKTSGEQSFGSEIGKRPAMMKRGSSMAEAWRSMSFRRKS